MSTYFVVNRNLTNKSLHLTIHATCNVPSQGDAMHHAKKLSCNLVNLPPCDPCKQVARNYVAWEAWEAWKY